MKEEPDLFSGEVMGDPPGQEGGGFQAQSGEAFEPISESFGSEGGPLAARMRPRTLEEVRGQRHLLDPGKPLRAMIEGGALSSMILWGPPGSGKTTLARLLARRGDAAFVPFSGVSDGVGRIREVVEEARTRWRSTGRRTILFCDEIHRLNRAQQDGFLHHVEDGTLILVGATTENPSFEVNRPLLSRAPVFVIHPLTERELVPILSAALEDGNRGLGGCGLAADPEALHLLAEGADGDARRALNALEAAAALVGPRGRIDVPIAREALRHRAAQYDKSGEAHYNLISALHKAIRGSDPDGALYWLARMVVGGEDPRYLARRLIRIAVEDVGMADPQALSMALAGWEAYHFLGSPEGELALAEVAVYLASAPKSNRIYRAWGAAEEWARKTPGAPVPLHIRNAPTELMEELGYGEGYRYDPDEVGGLAPQEYLPEVLRGTPIYDPGEAGYEAEVSKRLRLWKALRKREARGREGESEEPDATPEA